MDLCGNCGYNAGMTVGEVRKKYIEFFKSAPRNHVELDPAPLVLENDPTTLFTSAGMQPLVPYLMGEKHPKGVRLVNSQPAIRLQDIEEVGDNRHTTFFEMLGNWSLGDYFKEDQLAWFFEFLTDELKLDPNNIYVTVFSGDKDFGVARDDESINIWKKLFKNKKLDAEYVELGSEKEAVKLGMKGGRVFGYDVKKNWWSRTGTPKEMPIGDIGGPDSEVFYDFGEWRKIHENSPFKDLLCHPNCDCGRFLEIGNSVFMQYKKVGEKRLEELPNKNVDFGGGLERIAAAIKDDPDMFFTDAFWPIVEIIQPVANIKYIESPADFRVIADHLKAAVFLITNGVIPSNKQQGYVLRRLIRRAVVKMRNIKVPEHLISHTENKFEHDSIYLSVVNEVFNIYNSAYIKKIDAFQIAKILEDESRKFYSTLEKGAKLIDKEKPFDLYQTYGLPLEVIEELYKEKKLDFYKDEIEKEIKEHKEKSRTASKGMFKGGLADHSDKVVRLHTATHLLQASLRQILGEGVIQKGQNITKERSRFDFSHPQKLTEDELKKVEDLINEKIKENLTVKHEVLPIAEAEKTGALHAFGEKYGNEVNVYYTGEDLNTAFSKEFCGGPHIATTDKIERVTIERQEKVGAGIVRVYLKLVEG
jgi:alanyl-tRNA synthetase